MCFAVASMNYVKFFITLQRNNSDVKTHIFRDGTFNVVLLNPLAEYFPGGLRDLMFEVCKLGASSRCRAVRKNFVKNLVEIDLTNKKNLKYGDSLTHFQAAFVLMSLMWSFTPATCLLQLSVLDRET